MPTLLLRLSAPMQAWGTQSNFSHRDTQREPSKSGIVGLLCAAMGIPRSEPLHSFAALRMGVRVDQPGIIRRDYHTAGMGGVYKVSGGVAKSLIPSDRYYLADARFLVGLESDDMDFLATLQRALQNPAWFLFLGRKAFIPAERVWLKDGIQDATLLTALATYHWLGQGDPPPMLTVIVDDPSGEITRNDNPLSFEPRRFLPRTMKRQQINNPSFTGEEV